MSAPDLRIELLGAPRLRHRGALVETRVPPKTVALLAYLALAAPDACTRERGAFALWPDEPEESALANLRRYLYRLTRTLLPPPGATPWLKVGVRAIGLHPDAPIAVDLHALRAALADVARADEAIALYRAPLLETLDEPWAERAREQLGAEVTAYLRRAASARRAAGDGAGALACAEALLRLDPLDESAASLALAQHVERRDPLAVIRGFRAFAQRLDDEVGASPGAELHALYERALTDVAPMRAAPRRHEHLPRPCGPTFGREDDVARVVAALREHAVVTLTGTAGVGKTQLALETAALVADARRDGVRFVDLAPLGPRDCPARRVLEVLGAPRPPEIPASTLLVDALRDRRMLVVLDNAEHVRAACATVAEAIAAACPGVALLITSRTPLRCADEHVHPVAPLATDAAIALFEDRARRADPGYAAARWRDDVRELCERLDGIALAVVLAAARAGVLTPRRIRERLDDRLGLLVDPATPVPRHRAVEALIAWSEALLDAPERAVLLACSAFAGGWTLDAAASVAGIDEGVVLDAAAALVDASLLWVDRAAEPTRYRYPEPVRAFARERARAGGEQERLAALHARWAASFFVAHARAAERMDERAWLARAAPEAENALAALRWSLEAGRDPARGAELVVALRELWTALGSRDAVVWVDLAELRLGPDPALAARLAFTRALLLPSSPARADVLADAAARLRGNADETIAAQALVRCGVEAATLGRVDEARGPLEDGAARAVGLGLRRSATAAIGLLALVHAAAGDLATARGMSDAALIEAEREGYLLALHAALPARVRIEALDGRHEEALRYAAVRRGLDDPAPREAAVVPAAQELEILAVVAARAGDDERAARLFGAVDAALAAYGALELRAAAIEVPSSAAARRRLRRDLGARCDQLLAEGAALDPAALAALAALAPGGERPRFAEAAGREPSRARS